MTQHSRNTPQFYLTAPSPCPYLPGQEERNADHLLEQGAAMRCNNPPVLAWKLDRLLADRGRFRAMQAAARRLARPDSAARVADAVTPR